MAIGAERGDPAAGATRALGLRARIVLGFLVFGLLLSSGFAAAAYAAMDDFEGIVVRQLLHSELQQVIQSRRLDPGAPLPGSRRMYARVLPLAAVNRLAMPMRGLRPGIQVLDEDGEHETYVEVRDADARRYYYFINLGDVAEREAFVHWLLAAIVLVGTLSSAALGLLFGGYLIAPVQRLSRWVDASVPEQPSGALSSQFAADEVGALAAAFDRYQHRLDAFLRRERDFTADASHELRAPLSVLKAGMDLIAEDPALGAPGRRALQRMQRRAAELNGLLDVLLFLARAESGDAPACAPVALRQAWQQLLDSCDGEPRSVDVQLRGDEVIVSAPPRVCAVVFEQLLTRAGEHAAAGTLTVQFAVDRIALGPLSAQDAAVDAQQRSDERRALSLVARVCLRLGWRLQLAPDRIVLLLSPGA